jgi:hypothetical protein
MQDRLPQQERKIMAKDTKLMAKDTKTIEMPRVTEEEVVPSGQRPKAETGNFRLQVDRQTKAYFPSFEAAQLAGLKIKKQFPVVQITVYDKDKSTSSVLELPQK